MIVNILFDPFINYGFMCRAMVACCVLSISMTAMGIFLVLRRMSLMGDALSHAIFPGIAVGYFFSGASCIMMNIGGFVSGVIVVIFSNWVSEKTSLHKDASFAGFYLGFLALGVILISLQGSNIDLLNVLFGSILSVSVYALNCIGVISTITVFSIALFYRAFVIDTFDPDFFRNTNFKFSRFIQIFFLSIVVLNLIAGFQVTGTLMSVGMMILPGLAARFWVTGLTSMFVMSLCIALLCSWIGLLISFYTFLPAGPIIILCVSVVFFFSILFGNNEGIILFTRYKK